MKDCTVLLQDQSYLPKNNTFRPLKKTRFYFAPKDARIQPTYDLYKSKSGNQLRFTGYEGELSNGSTVPLDYISSSGVGDLLNGESERIGSKFRYLSLPY